MQKKCFKCHRTKDVSEFYKRKRMSHGVLGKCKECTKSDARAYREANIDKVMEYDRNRPNAKERNERNKANAKLPHARKNARMRGDKWASKNKHKVKAANAVNNAVRDGRLTRGPCEVCGDTKVQGHHDDYSKPLAVRWLCVTHHSLHHKQEREKLRQLNKEKVSQ